LNGSRRPAVAGTFYPRHERELREIFDNLFAAIRSKTDYSEPEFKEVFGIVSPHAGYQYSGLVAAKGFSFLKKHMPSPERVIIIGPNHQGIGSMIASTRKSYWITPLGDVAVDVEGVKKLSSTSHLVDIDDLAHEYEHSLEVQLPFLQYIYGGNFKIIPICMMAQDKTFAEELGTCLSEIFVRGKDVIVASSDFTHYEPHENALKKDRGLINYIEKLDVNGFYDYLSDRKMSVCGFGPIATLMAMSKKLNASESKLLMYMTSGEVVGEYDQVVGYASIAFGR